TEPVQGLSGSAGALLTVLASDVPSIRGQLDTLAKGLVNGVNYLHMQGWTAAGDALGNANWNPVNGPTGSRVEFFDSSRLTAGTISLSVPVQNNAAVIAAGTTQSAVGDNTLALNIATLRDNTGMAALHAAMGDPAFGNQVGIAVGSTYGEHYR